MGARKSSEVRVCSPRASSYLVQKVYPICVCLRLVYPLDVQGTKELVQQPSFSLRITAVCL